ncbi:response regulator transcription factor [Oceanidesulfovibrio marinus]|uniref:Response regulator n=1 Tax=Oceanidesulfovibrio marinus TaxID=370038 RepID=A0A6P1ZGV3_9BACT|nr:response regulator [Oceanidesulfovibrio marinus]QJT10705.1 response regulator [Oceanidesulfovibrio marinus]TVM34068.1 response regulator [Oceanidesulfovibrio marinus]
MGKKLLIVEDELHIRTLLEQALEDLEEEYAVEILTASDGEEGLAIIRQERPQAVFLDIMMPKMNGYEVCRAIKQDPELKDTIIVLLTAKGQEADRRKGLEIGAYDYMTKPFDPDEVVELAKELLQIVD